MTNFKNLLNSTFLKEEFSVNLQGRKFKIKLKPNINPTKQGLRIQFAYDDGEEMSSSEKSQIETSLQNFLNKAFEPYKMSVNTDPDVPNEADNVIGFYLTVEQLENFVKRSLKKVSNDFKDKTRKETPDEEND